MNSKLATLPGKFRSAIVKHSPELLAGLGLSGMVATTVLAVKATPKALSLLEEKAADEGVTVEELTIKEKVQTCWKCYIPAAVSGVTSAVCIIGANSVNARRNAALAAAYTLSDTALREYRDAVVETVGEKKERVVRDKAAEKKIEKQPVSASEVVITPKGDTLCYDDLSGRYFKSDIDKIRRAATELNEMMYGDINGSVSLNDFYDELELSHTKMGDELGWRVDKGSIKVSFSAQVADDGTPCLVMYFDNPPIYGYDSVY